MKILAFDTALGACSVALAEFTDADGCTVLAQEFEARQRGHAEVLVPMIERVLSTAGATYADIDRLGVTVGPGTFTGVRVGVAAARGLSLAAGIPIVTLSTLEAIALTAANELDDVMPGRIVAVTDARRGDLYLQIFTDAVQELTQPQVLSVDAAAGAVPDDDLYLCGTGAHLLKDALGGARQEVTVASTNTQPDAAAFVCSLAGRPVCDTPPEPLYLRAPDAKLPARMSVERQS